MLYLSPEDAKAEILKYIRGEPPEYLVDKFIIDVLDYCHRDDFPKALVYSVVEVINTGLQRKSDAPLKRLKQGDTEFEFAVAERDDMTLWYDVAFASLRPKLNLYRKVAR